LYKTPQGGNLNPKKKGKSLLPRETSIVGGKKNGGGRGEKKKRSLT